MNKLLILLLFIITSCNGQELNLQKENELLKKELSEIKNEHQKLLNENLEVTLANTTVKYLTSKYNGQKYQIKVHFPRNYNENKQKKYPVLYVLDAETNFGGVSYIVQRLIKDKLIPEILIVGIAYNTDYKNFYKLRSRDLTPIVDKNLKPNHTPIPSGGASLFCDFIEFELFPYINKKFRTQENETAIYGHSFGGLFGTYTFLKRPHMFNKYLVLGPSLWFKDKLLIREAREMEFTSHATKLYMASGELESRIDDHQLEFVKILEGKNISGLKLKSEIKENETHRTIFGIGFTNGLRYLYSNNE